jgi:hypothetical protein
MRAVYTHKMRVGWGAGGLHKHLTRSEGTLEVTRAHDAPKHVHAWLVTHAAQGAAHSTVGRWWGQWGRSTDTTHTWCDHDSEATKTHTRTWEQR